MIKIEDIIIKRYPFQNDCALIVTLDDCHPQGSKNGRIDFGFDNFINNSNFFWNQLEKSKKEIPALKFTLFTVANWIDKPEFPQGIFTPLRRLFKIRKNYPEGTFDISKKEFRNWVNFINQKVKENLVEIGLHGYTHHNPNKKYAPSQEFKGISEEETENKIKNMLNLFDKSGIIYKKVFRIPGWGYEKHLDRVLHKYKINYVSNSSDFYSSINLGSKGSGVPNQNITQCNFSKDGIYNYTANCYADQTQRAVEIAKNNGVIIIHGHISQTTFGLKYVDKSFSKNLLKIKNEIENQTLKKIWFTTLSELGEYQDSLNKIVYKIVNNTIIFENNSDYDLNGFSFIVANQPFVIKLNKKSKYTFDLKNLNEDSKKYKVSCILTVFNGSKTILQSLDSIATQTYKNLEIIVVNDGSKDNTQSLVESYINKTNDNRIKLISQKNLGRAKARNNGESLSKGEIITFMEDDAIYHKDYLLIASSSFEEMQNGKCGGLIGPHYVWNKYASITTRIKDIERRRNFLKYKPFSTWFYSKNLFNKIGRFNESLEFGEDIEPANRIKGLGLTFKYIPECKWLHKEPEKFFDYIVRKFKGGIGLASIEKLNPHKKTVPIKWSLLFFCIITILVFSLFLSSIKNFLLLIFLLSLILLLIRIRDIKNSLKVSNENIMFICLGIYVEYIWWIATFLGLVYGRQIGNSKILNLLRGR